MPAYMSIVCQFSLNDRAGLVNKFCDAFFGKGVKFNGVPASVGESKMTLDQVVEWNQSEMDSYTFGFDDLNRPDYRQIRLRVPPFSQCRLILRNRFDLIEFECIVPEDEINSVNTGSLERACRRIWSRLPALAIESYAESMPGFVEGPSSIESGTPPAAELFAFIDYDCTQQDYVQYFQVKPLDRGYMLTPKDIQQDASSESPRTSGLKRLFSRLRQWGH